MGYLQCLDVCIDTGGRPTIEPPDDSPVANKSLFVYPLLPTFAIVALLLFYTAGEKRLKNCARVTHPKRAERLSPISLTLPQSTAQAHVHMHMWLCWSLVWNTFARVGVL